MFALLMLINKSVFSQNGLPRKVLVNKDTCALISIQQLECANEEHINNLRNKEINDSLNKIVVGQKKIIVGQRDIIHNRNNKIDNDQILIKNKTAIIKNDSIDAKVYQDIIQQDKKAYNNLSFKSSLQKVFIGILTITNLYTIWKLKH